VQFPSEDVLRGKQLAFLVGAPRSGTTWLQLILSRSPSVVTAQETDLFNVFLHPMVEEWNRYRKTGVPVCLSEVLAEEEFRTLLHHISGFVFAKIAQAKPCASVVLEKTPNHINCWREILDLWPDSHFVHIIRDPRAVVASRRAAVKNWGREHDWGSPRISMITEAWISFVSNGRQIRSATQNYQEVLYEELMSNGPAVLMRVFGKLGVASNLDECYRYVDECSMQNLKSAKLDAAPFDLAKAGPYRFRIGSTEGWRRELSASEIALVERLAGPLMADLAYERAARSKLAAAHGELLYTVERARRKAAKWLRSRLGQDC
jgi:hypothetical protein